MSILELLPLTLAIIVFLAVLAVRLLKIFVVTSSTKPKSRVHERIKEEPWVAIHMAIRNENPEMVIKTLESLCQLKYEKYHVFVLDNNTTDESRWKPVAEYCAQHEDLFTFFHVDNVRGFKAGALNLLLEKTPQKFEFISIVDSDVIVESNFFADIIPEFADKTITHIQTPLGEFHSGQKSNSQLSLIYKLFLAYYLPFSNKFRITPFIGNMGIIRRSAIEAAGPWNGFYLCEDMEFSYRVLSLGGNSSFINYHYGRSFLPSNMANIRQQFYRWNFGNAQIFRDYFLKTFLRNDTNGFVKKVLYFAFPAIHLNLFMIPFFIYTILILVLQYMSIDIPYSHEISIVIFSTFAVELLSDVMIFTELRKREKAPLKTLFMSLLNYLGMYWHNCKSSYAVLFKKTMPFKITAKGADRKTHYIPLFTETFVAVTGFCVLLALCQSGPLNFNAINIFIITILTCLPTTFAMKV